MEQVSDTEWRWFFFATYENGKTGSEIEESHRIMQNYLKSTNAKNTRISGHSIDSNETTQEDRNNGSRVFYFTVMNAY